MSLTFPIYGQFAAIRKSNSGSIEFGKLHSNIILPNIKMSNHSSLVVFCRKEVFVKQ